MSEQIFNYDYQDKFNFEDLENRKLFLNDAIDVDLIDSIVYHILRYNRLDAGIEKEKRKPITLYINSPGGDVSAGYGIIDAILTSETPVYTVNQGLCASMGFLIFIAGHKRYSMPHSQFLLHDGSVFAFNSTEKARDTMEFQTVQLEGMTKEFVLGHSKIEADLYDRRRRYEWWMLPDEAKEVGVVDYIVGKDCAISEIV